MIWYQWFCFGISYEVLEATKERANSITLANGRIVHKKTVVARLAPSLDALEHQRIAYLEEKLQKAQREVRYLKAELQFAKEHPLEPLPALPDAKEPPLEPLPALPDAN